MKISRLKFVPGLVVAGGVVVAAVTNGCSAASQLQAAQSSLCCKGYQAGTDMSNADLGVTGNVALQGQFYGFAQATGDLSVAVSAAVTDITNACRSIATDLNPSLATMGSGGDAGASMGADAGTGGTDAMTFWCNAASVQIDAAFTATGTAKGMLTLDIEPPHCDVSISAQANCQAKCDVSASCNVQATPPTCTGGTLEVDCMGSCSASATAPTFDCTGSCSGNCTGTCEAQGGVAVDCQGKCDGTCAAGGMGGGTGIQADGSCNGTCSGKCTLSATAPKASCKGTCSGTCDAMCTASPGMASVQCSGSCSAMATPLTCKGGKLSGGCMASGSCNANCSASAQASATCTPPAVHITASGSVMASASGQFNILLNTLETNLPKIFLVIKARGQAFIDQISAVGQAGVTISGQGDLGLGGTACFVDIAADAATAVGNMTAALSVSGSVVTHVQ